MPQRHVLTSNALIRIRGTHLLQEQEPYYICRIKGTKIYLVPVSLAGQ